jgi:hypothetical protein
MKKNLLILSVLIYSNFVNAQWDEVNSGLKNLSIFSLLVSDSNVFAGTLDSGVFISKNNGSNWTAVNNGLTSLKIWSLAKSGSNIFAGTSNGVFLSNNNGNSWNRVSNGLSHQPVLTLLIDGSNIFAGTFGGGAFISSNNGNSWTAINNGIAGLRVYSIVKSGSNIFAATYGSGVFMSINNGLSWTQVNTGLINLTQNTVWSLIVNGSNIFAGTFNAGVFVSNNNGSNWTAVNNGELGENVKGFAVNDSIVYAGTNRGIYKSSNNGGVWKSYNDNLESDAQCIAFSKYYIFVGSFGGGVFRRSINNGVNVNGLKNKKNNIKLYPNPNKGHFIVESNNAINKIEIFNILGEQIFTSNFNNFFSATNKLIIDIGIQPNGIYYYNITSDSGDKEHGLFNVSK